MAGNGSTPFTVHQPFTVHTEGTPDHMSKRPPKKTRKPIKVKRGLSANLMLTIGVVVIAVGIIVAAILVAGGKNEKADHVSADILRKPDSNTLTQAPDNKVTVVEFLDYQCPACAQYYKNITRKLEDDYAGKITFVTRNFPIQQVHPLAAPAARAAEAAGIQGKYKEMYHALYDNYEKWALASDGRSVSEDQQRAQQAFDAYATQIGLDLNKFHEDANSDVVKQRIERDMADGEKAGVESTPTLFVNGNRFKPSGDSFGDVSRKLRKQIDKELKK